MNNPVVFAPITKAEYESQNAWGLLASINFYDCDPVLIKTPEAIHKFVVKLCELIDMKRYGEPLIERFADGPLEGYSMMQFIETSSITAHFDEQENRAFIDIFSCKFFETEDAINFCLEYFKASRYRVQTMIRD